METGLLHVNIMLTCGYEKQQITVMLGILADGTKLPPYLILNRKTVPKKETFPKDVVVRASPKAWMTGELMLDWLKTVWDKRPGVLRRPRSMLVLDSFKGHLVDSVEESLKGKKSDMVVIPGGMTSQLQPLDVSVNKPFKDYVKDEYETWLLSSNLPLTDTGKIKKPPASQVAQWVSNAWAKIDAEIIVKAFKRCCISNALDGSEDDTLFEEVEDDSDTSDVEEEDEPPTDSEGEE